MIDIATSVRTALVNTHPSLPEIMNESSFVQDLRYDAAMPAGLRYVKGWPVRLPTLLEAAEIVAARRSVLAHHNMPEIYPTPHTVVERFAELMAANDAAEARAA